ncbi:2-(hydroxymethyl)glutarate dehydrogenase [Geobacillus sp. BCO2]|nr:2-(hydroxymethyl)glutarate dehydrogenase [Geobacillus sp. BCO2]
MGKAIHHLGENGKGTMMKLVVNLMLAEAMAAFSEAVSLGEALGFDKETVVNMLLNTPTAAPFLQGKKDYIIHNRFPAEFPLEHMHKDLHLVAQSAYERGITLPLANLAKELYGLAKQYSWGQDDFSAVYRLLSVKNDRQGAGRHRSRFFN